MSEQQPAERKGGSQERRRQELVAAAFHQIAERGFEGLRTRDIAARAGVKTVVLTPLPASSDPKDSFQRFAEEVKKQFTGPVLIAKDLMEF